MASQLDTAIQRYQTAIAALAQAASSSAGLESKVTSEAIILEALMARNEVQSALEDASQISGEAVQVLNALDQKLRAAALTLAPFTQSKEWRASFNPPESAWWWMLEAPKAKIWTQFDWLWNAVAVTCLTISLGLVGDISSRFLKGGPDTIGAIAVSAQSVLTLLAAGGALTKAGQEGSKQMLKKLNIPEHYWQELGAAGSVLLLSGLFGLRQSLPAISNWYSELGKTAYAHKDWGSAEEHFKRALEMDADNGSVHFWLGRLYEDLQKTDAAKTQYQYVLAEKPEAVNNLARLNILDKRYSTAVSLLQKPLFNEQQSYTAETQFALLKNMGWARLKQGNYADADAKLWDAIELGKSAKLAPTTTAAAYCLMAQVIEAQGNPQKPLIAQKKALPNWQTCARYGSVTVPEEDEWIVIAQKRLATLELSQ
jgi:tetratricopeptide (TPR) repeat protein